MSTASGLPGPEVDTQPGKEMDLSRVTQHESLVGRERRANRACKGFQEKHGIEHMALSTWGGWERVRNTPTHSQG